MEENKDYDVRGTDKSAEKRASCFLRDFLSGICIGIAFIIPGFSGGSVAAILGIYERLVDAVANIFWEIRKSIVTLLPVGLGLVVGAAALLFPLGYMLERFPLPTVSLFVGLAIGGIPSLAERLKGRPTAKNVTAFVVPLLLASLMCFVPIGSEVNLFDLDFGGYVLLFLVGILGACALVTPGISGSMILLILGYYNPIVRLITNHFFRFKDLGKCILVLGTCGAGIVVGFLLISVLMKYLIKKYPRGTYFAIIGFIVGSLPTVYFSTMRSSGILTPSLELVGALPSAVTLAACIFLIILGACASNNLTVLVGKKAE